jgi:hypothetical protein
MGYISQAIGRWNNLLKFDDNLVSQLRTFQGYENWSGITVADVNIFNDAQTGTVASCGPNWFVDIDGGSAPGINTLSFSLNINEAFQTQLTAAEWVDVMTHELGHALGIGVYWDTSFSDWGAGGYIGNTLLIDGTYYTNALTAYNNIHTDNSLALTFGIQTETSGGPGTAGGHWEDQCINNQDLDNINKTFAGFENELMIGFVIAGGSSVISSLTLGALADFGYVVNTQPEGDPVTACGVTTSSVSRKMKLDCSCSNKNTMQSLGTVTKQTKKDD